MKHNINLICPVWESGIVNNILVDTCKKCLPYVNKIIIAHCGPQSEFSTLKKLFDYSDNIIFYHYSTFDGDAGRVIQELIHLYNSADDWVMLLDSDQRPSNNLLLNLHDIVDDCKNNNVTGVRFPTYHHHWDVDDNLNIEVQSYNNMDDVIDNHGYTIKSLFQVKDTYIKTNHGMHYDI